MNNVRIFSLVTAFLGFLLVMLHGVRLAQHLDVVFDNRAVPAAASILFVVLGALVLAGGVWLSRKGTRVRNETTATKRGARAFLVYATVLYGVLGLGQFARLVTGATWTIGSTSIPEAVSMLLVVLSLTGIYFGAGIAANIKPVSVTGA